MKSQRLFTPFFLLLLAAGFLSACTIEAWRDDPAIAAARSVCQSDSGMDYDCIERQAVASLNPEICHLAGIAIDDMCLQAVYEAADDSAICNRIYLQGVVPNCRAYYTQRASPSKGPNETFEITPSTQLSSHIFSPSPGATSTREPTRTASPTPLYTLDLSGYVQEIFPPIDISHNPPLIARSDETVQLVFDFANTFCLRFPISCIPEGNLFYVYGESEVFASIPLADEIVDEMESLVARLPAADQAGRSLRYYAEFTVPEAAYMQRYPVAGTIDLFTAEDFIPVELPLENAVRRGEIVYDFFWGYGPNNVRQATYQHYHQRVGPPAMDVANDGRIALLDPVNERILIYHPIEDNYYSYTLPFTYGFWADLGFDRDGRLMVCDYQGVEVESTYGPDPTCYLLLPSGKMGASTPLYIRSASYITGDLKIIDYSDSRLVAPFSPQGKANSREIQRHKETWMFPRLYLQGRYPYIAHYADLGAALAFEVHSASPLGALIDFEKTPQDYLMTFSLGDRLRAVWIDPSGFVLKDVTLPKGGYSEINGNGQVAVTPDGSLYVMGSTERGIEIHFVGAP